MEMCVVLKIVASLVVVGGVGLVVHIYNSVWLKSERMRRKMRMQGIRGPPPSFLYGNLPEMQKIQLQAMKAPPNHTEFVAHDYTSTVFPYFEQWRKEYGTHTNPPNMHSSYISLSFYL